MAHKALTQLAADAKEPSDNRENILARLSWLTQMLRGKSMASEVSMSGTLWAISCIEAADLPENLEDCGRQGELHKDWEGLLRNRTILQQAQISAGRGPVLSSADIEGLKTAITHIKSKDAVTRFDYDAELKFYQDLVALGGKVQKAVEQASERHPDVHLIR